MNRLMSAKLVELQCISKQAEEKYKEYVEVCAKNCIATEAKYVSKDGKTIREGYKDDLCTFYRVVTMPSAGLDTSTLLNTKPLEDSVQAAQLEHDVLEKSLGKDNPKTIAAAKALSELKGMLDEQKEDVATYARLVSKYCKVTNGKDYWTCAASKK